MAKWKVEIISEQGVAILETCEYTSTLKDAMLIAKKAVDKGCEVEIWKLVKRWK